MSILLIEDDDRLIRLIQECITSREHLCDIIKIYDDIVKLDQIPEYDLIILDYFTCAVDPIGLLARIRRDLPGVLIIMISVSDDLRKHAEKLGYGHKNFITDSYRIGELLARIREAISDLELSRSSPDDSSPKHDSTPASSGVNEAEWVEKLLPPTGKPLPPDNVQSNANRSGHIIVVGNEKGGTGKSTISMHVIISLLYEGYRVASIDLDTPQRTLSRYLQNRKSIANRQHLKLLFPEHLEAAYHDDEFESLETAVRRLVNVHDFVVVDTPGSKSPLSRAIHGWADTLITPINDSLMDLDVLALIDPVSQTMERPSHYGEMILDARRRKAKGSIDWIVLRNRLSNLASRNKNIVADTMLHLSAQLGFRCCAGLSERVIYKELFLLGLTLLDLREKGIGIPLSMSHVAARQELRELVTAITLKQRLKMARTDGHSVTQSVLGHWDRSRGHCVPSLTAT